MAEQLTISFESKPRALKRPRDYYGQFLLWKNRNPQVWQKVVETALQAASVADRIGISEVWERVRWWAKYEATGEDYKLNNNHRAPAARYLEENYPELRGKFEKRNAQCDTKEGL